MCDLVPLRAYIASTQKDWNYITPQDFYEKYYLKPKKMKDIYLLDLRKREEYRKFHIRGAKNIFWLDLLKEKSLKRLPKNKKIFLICYVGHTSSQAMVLLRLLGYDVVSIKFGYGISPVSGVPIAGWRQWGFPLVEKK